MDGPFSSASRSWDAVRSSRGLLTSKVGDPAPDFQLQATDGKTYTLADFQGKQAVVLALVPQGVHPWLHHGMQIAGRTWGYDQEITRSCIL